MLSSNYNANTLNLKTPLSQQTEEVDPIIGTILGQRRRRWANISPIIIQPLAFAGVSFWATITLSHF